MSKITLKVYIEVDEDTEHLNPAHGHGDMDGQWQHISFSNRHYNYEHPDKYLRPIYNERGRLQGVEPRSIGLRRKMQVGLAYVLSYFEHGQCEWGLQGETFQCQWDTAQIAGLLIWPHKPNEMGAKTPEDRAEDARNFLKVYTDWCNGEVYGYRVTTQQLDPDDPDYLDEDGDEISSCWGYFGSDSDYMKQEIQSAIDHFRAEHPNDEVTVVSASKHYDFEEIKKDEAA